MLKYYFKSVKDQKIKKLSEFRPGAWILAYDPTPEDIKKLESLGVDEDFLEDALDYFEVPHLEYEEGVIYFFTRYAVAKKVEGVATAPILIAISPEFILTLSHKKPDFITELINSNKDINTTQRIKLMLILLDHIIRQYNISLIHIRRQLTKFVANLEKVSDEDLKQIVRIESRLTDYLSALIATSHALDEMIHKEKLLTLHEQDVDILEDLLTDTQQIIDNAKSVYKTAQNIRATHEVIIGHQLNATMKMLAAITVILAIPTVVAGIFGMNTWLPTSEGPAGFLIVIFITALLSFAVAKFLSKKGWM